MAVNDLIGGTTLCLAIVVEELISAKKASCRFPKWTRCVRQTLITSCSSASPLHKKDHIIADGFSFARVIKTELFFIPNSRGIVVRAVEAENTAGWNDSLELRPKNKCIHTARHI